MIMKNRLLRGIVAAAAWSLIGAGVAHAHGGMAGPDELGPPMGTSIAIGLACYYLITLWPARRTDDERGSSNKSERRTR
jgi:hypothetical protein